MGHLYAAPDAEVWPDNWSTFITYRRICDQWIVGPGGIVGLNLGAVYPLLDRSGLTGDDWMRTLDDIRAMADAVAEQLMSNSKTES